VLVLDESTNDLDIEALEVEQKALEEKMSAPDYYRQGAEALKEDRRRAEEIEGKLMGRLGRWEELERRAAGGADN
jgi:hypothetical protein